MAHAACCAKSPSEQHECKCISMGINDWPAAERPRERLLSLGPGSLSDAELLAIFLRVGVAGMDAVTLARTSLQQAGGLRTLLCMSEPEFTSLKGLGQAKYVQLQASLELSRRFLDAQLQQSSFFNSTSAAKHYFRAQLGREQREVFIVAFLNSRYELLVCEPLFYGTINAAQIYAREVVKAALRHNAAAVVFAHNHPSGSLEPSDADRRITRELTQALALVEIQVLDHIIVGNGTASMAELGLL